MENSLYHSGRKGMKWGAHVFCGPNCSKHGKNKESFRVRAKAKKQAKIEAKSKKKAEEEKMTTEQKKEQVLKSRSAKELYENAHLFSDAELSAAYNRLTTEKNIKSLIPVEVNKGKEFVDNAADWTKSMKDLTSNVTGLYNNVAKVYNSVPALNQGRDKMPIIGEKSNDKKKDD